MKVWTKSAQSVGTSAVSRAQMAEGGGSSTGGTLAPRVTTSQTTSRARPKTTGMTRPVPVSGSRPLRMAAESRSTKSQAKAQPENSASQWCSGMATPGASD
ncbi:hypothetical protein D3C87_1599770 [compost metagenome]